LLNYLYQLRMKYRTGGMYLLEYLLHKNRRRRLCHINATTC
jgi:hypothetical protein